MSELPKELRESQMSRINLDKVASDYSLASFNQALQDEVRMLRAKLKRQDEMIEACESMLERMGDLYADANGREFKPLRETLTKLKKLREQDSE